MCSDPLGIKKNDIDVDENKFEEIKVRFKNKKLSFHWEDLFIIKDLNIS